MQKGKRILQLCACLDPHAEQQNQLIAACSGFHAWNELLILAEQEGMGPLLSRHLRLSQITVPDTFSRGLKFLSLRHRRANTVLMESLAEVLSIFNEAGIKSLVVKGAALCNSLYPEIGLRPMRDIDLLLDEKQILQAQILLQAAGFTSSSQALPDRHYHLQPLVKTVDGMEVAIELHLALFPKLPPFYTEFPFAASYAAGISFQVNGIEARTLANEKMLWHLFEHGFHPPLTYESCK